MQETLFHPWVRKILWRRKWQPTPLFLPGEFHEQRRLVDYSPWGCKRVRPDLATKQKSNIQKILEKAVEIETVNQHT